MLSESVPPQSAESGKKVEEASGASLPSAAISPTRRKRRKRIAMLMGGLILVWLAAAYLIIPALWERYAHRHPTFEDLPGVTYTADGIPADPINVALIGTKAEVMRIMLAAKWFPADPLTFRSSLKIAEASVLKREDMMRLSAASFSLAANRTWRSSRRSATIHGIATMFAFGNPTNATPTAGPSGSDPPSMTNESA